MQYSAKWVSCETKSHVPDGAVQRSVLDCSMLKAYATALNGCRNSRWRSMREHRHPEHAVVPGARSMQRAGTRMWHCCASSWRPSSAASSRRAWPPAWTVRCRICRTYFAGGASCVTYIAHAVHLRPVASLHVKQAPSFLKCVEKYTR